MTRPTRDAIIVPRTSFLSFFSFIAQVIDMIDIKMYNQPSISHTMNSFCELSTTMDATLGTKDTQTAIYIFMTTGNVTSLLTYRWYHQCIILSKQPTFTKSHNWNSYFTQENTFHMSFKRTPYLLQTFTFQVSTIICVSTSFTFMETNLKTTRHVLYKKNK